MPPLKALVIMLENSRSQASDILGSVSISYFIVLIWLTTQEPASALEYSLVRILEH